MLTVAIWVLWCSYDTLCISGFVTDMSRLHMFCTILISCCVCICCFLVKLFSLFIQCLFIMFYYIKLLPAAGEKRLSSRTVFPMWQERNSWNYCITFNQIFSQRWTPASTHHGLHISDEICYLRLLCLFSAFMSIIIVGDPVSTRYLAEGYLI